MIIMKRRGRSVSAPSLSASGDPCSTRVSSACFTRGRTRRTAIPYEQGKDSAAYWMCTWGCEEMCCVLKSLLSRCRVSQLQQLRTTMESVPHQDFVVRAEVAHPRHVFQRLSTPVSRQVKARLRRSLRPENIALHRTQSLLIQKDITPLSLWCVKDLEDNSLEATPPHKLPGLRPFTLPPSPSPSTWPHPSPGPHPTSTHTHPHPHSHSSPSPTPHTPTSRISTPGRRHMACGRRQCCGNRTTPALFSPATPPTIPIPTHTPPIISTHTPPIPRALSDMALVTHNKAVHLSLEAQQFLVWFSKLREDWQQKEILQMIVWNLDQRELYYLTALLIRHQYRDFIAELTEALSMLVLKHVPSKDLLRFCCRVSPMWNKRVRNEMLWKHKCLNHIMRLPFAGGSWRQHFIHNLALDTNWRKGRFSCHALHSGPCRALCVAILHNKVAAGFADSTIMIWDILSGVLINSLQGHRKAVWSLCFYGKEFLISGSSDRTVKIWNIRSGSCEVTLEEHSGVVWSMQRRKDVFITGSHDKTAVVWNIRHCSPTHLLEGHTGAVFAVELDGSAQLAYTGSGDKTIRVWEVVTGCCLQVVKTNRTHPVVSLHWNLGYLASACGNSVMLWNVMEGNFQRVSELRGHEDRAECVSLRVHSSASCTGLLLSAGRDKTIRLWDIKSCRCLQVLNCHSGFVNALCSSEVCMASASDDCTVQVWDFHPKHKETTTTSYRAK